MLKLKNQIVFILLTLLLACSKDIPQTEVAVNDMWYAQPAKDWMQALPIGNGRLGAMVYGNPNKEQIQLNEDSLWPGENGWGLAEGTPEDLKSVRELLIAGENKKADALFVDKFLTKSISRSHQTLGDLWIDFGNAEYTNYKRGLDFDNAEINTSYKVNGSSIKQSVIASYPDDVLAIKYTTDSKEGFSASISMDRPLDEGHETAKSFIENNQLVMQGEITQYEGQFKGKKDPITSGVKFDTRIKINANGGKVEYSKNSIELKNVKNFTIFLVVNTSYYHENYIEKSKQQLKNVSSKLYKDVYAAHTADFNSLYAKMQLNLKGGESTLPTDARLEQVKNGAVDIGLEEVLFDYGRYLLISSSRKGSLPANLQGLWNKDILAPWNADYHLNINLQMNHWLANVTNLDELNDPMFNFIDELIENGKIAAKVNYDCEGSFIPHATDIWATSFLRSSTAYWGASFGAGGWMMQHYWNHYHFTQDQDFLKNQAFPAMQEIAKFYSDWVIVHPETGKLVSAPSSSPENSFKNEKRDTVALCLGSAKDQQVIHELFTNYLQAASILNIENEWTKTIKDQLPKLRSGIQIGSDGRLLEWDKEYEEVEPGHRHMSHLYAFHPGNQITQSKTPELVDAVRKSINYRVENGGGHTGWSRAWLINLQARLLDAELAHENIQLLLQKSMALNLFDEHPPFQIDGNFGYTAGVAEMLIQSHEKGIIRILPALPMAWKAGKAMGLKARGNIEVDMEWEKNQLVSAALTAQEDQAIKLIYSGKTKEILLKKGETIYLNHEL